MASRRPEAELLRALPAPLVLLDPTGHIAEVSERGAAALGRSRAALLGTELATHLGAAGGARLRDALLPARR